MRTFCALWIMAFAMMCARAQTTAPLEVVNSAITATNDLGQQVVLGKFKVTLDRMYPQWKDRLSKRLGGGEALDKQFDEALAQMAKMGASTVSFKTFGFPRVYEVYPGKKVEVVDGKEVETMIYTKWLLLIPTEVRYRMMQEQDAIIIESKGYQVVIADKNNLDWKFIDGADLKVQDLRSLFITLPQDMKLPEIQRRVVPKNELLNN